MPASLHLMGIGTQHWSLVHPLSAAHNAVSGSETGAVFLGHVWPVLENVGVEQEQWVCTFVRLTVLPVVENVGGEH